MSSIFESRLKPDTQNANEGTQRGRGLLEKSLRQLGAGRSILTDKDGNVIAGNKTLESAADIDLPVRIVETDGNELVVVKRTDLDLYSETDKRARQLAYADNKVAEIDLAWKPEQIAVDFEPLELKEWGFEDPNPPVADAEPQIDRAAELNEKWQVKTGDLWKIGEHRLLCGDSTVKADVDRVMQGDKADMVWTDPPYGVDYEGGAGNKVKREKLDGDATGDLYSPGLANLKHACKKSAPMYVWFADRGGKPVYDAIAEIGYEVRAMIVWNKLDAHYGAFMAQYMQKHEPCLYIVDGNANWIGATNEVTVWDIKQPSRNENHPTEKPVELAIRAISNHDALIVADFFGGSGTCMLASHNLNRKCRMIEKEPKFCAVILQRMSDAFSELTIERVVIQ